MLILISVILIIYLVLLLIEKKICKKSKITIYFGIPGSGKSTIASLISKKNLKKRDVYSNFAIKGTYKIEKEDLGYFDIQNSLIIFDEAGCDFDNRNWKENFSKEQVYFLKHHRHYKDDIIYFSQNLDMDIKIRNLSDDLRIVNKSIIPFFVSERRIKKKIGIDKDTKQLIEQYKYVFLSRKWYFMPNSWKLFNSYTKKDLPKKEWTKY